MATFIKTGFWEKRINPKQGYKGELNLDLLIQQNAPPSSVATDGGSLYSTDPAAGPGFSTNGGIFLGQQAGLNTANANSSNFLGINAGRDATNANESNFLGPGAGFSAANAQFSNFFGPSAGAGATGANNSNFLGNNAGYLTTSANNSNFLGQNAGSQATSANNSNFLGNSAGKNSTGNNVNAFGVSAGEGNTLSGKTIFSNTSMPSYADHTAAAAAITVALGASAGDTYLYHNQATNSIGAVRL